MKSKLAIWMLLGASAFASFAWGQGTTKPAPKAGAPAAEAPRPTFLLKEFRLVPINEARLSAVKPGMIVALPVKDGHVVKEGDVLGQIDDRESQASVKAASAEIAVAEMQASSDAPVKAAEAAYQVAETELKKALEINAAKSNAVNATEVERLRLTMVKSKYQIAVAEQELDVAKLNIGVKSAQKELAELDAELRKIRAPYDAEVVQVIRHVGEWVQAGDPLMHIVQMDRLRVQGYLHLNDISIPNRLVSSQNPAATPGEVNIIDPSEIIGRDCEVLVDFPKGKQETFKSKVTFVSQVQDTGDKIRVWIEIENKKVNGRWTAQPGQMASVKVLLDPPPKPKVDPKAPAGKPAVKPPVGNSEKPAPANNDVTKPDLTKPDPTKSDPAKPETEKPEASKPETPKSDAPSKSPENPA